MIKEVAGAVMTAFMGTLCLWLVLPMLNTAKIAVFANIDQSDPTTAQLVDMADNIFLALGFFVLLITGFIVINYATRRDPFQSMGG